MYLFSIILLSFILKWGNLVFAGKTGVFASKQIPSPDDSCGEKSENLIVSIINFWR